MQSIIKETEKLATLRNDGPFRLSFYKLNVSQLVRIYITINTNSDIRDYPRPSHAAPTSYPTQAADVHTPSQTPVEPQNAPSS
jgi:hypothetical protein